MPDPQPPKPTPLKRFALQRPPLAPPGTVRIDQAPVPPPPFSPWQLWGQGLLETVVDPIRGAFAGASGPEDTLAAKAGELFATLPPIAGAKQLLTGGRGLYSRVDEALKLLPKKGAHPNKIASILKNNASTEELAYRGVPEFLASKGNATVTPDELAAHLAAHPAPVPRVVTRGASTDPAHVHAARNLLESGATPEEALTRLRKAYRMPSDEALRDALYAAQHPEYPAGPTKFGNYTVPGGESYRETLVTLPPQPKPNQAALEADIQAGQARLQELYQQAEGLSRRGPDALKPVWAEIEDLQAHHRDLMAKMSRELSVGRFTSGHFDEPNVLVHTRSNERTLPTGERGRFVEEVQSDWHQKGKKTGYAAPPEEVEAMKARLNAIGAEKQTLAQQRDPRTNQMFDEPRWHELSREQEAIVHRYNRTVNDTVPDAPFKESWPDLGLKQQVLETAADPEASWIGFTSGKTQSERYDLSKQFSEIHYSGTNLKAYDHAGNAVISQTGIRPEELPKWLGDEGAEKLLAQPKQGTLRSLTGVDLKTESKGMRTFYDEILPKRLEKIVKPFRGTVERGTVPRKIGTEDSLRLGQVDPTPQLGEAFFDALAEAGTIDGKVPVGKNATLMTKPEMAAAFASEQLTPFQFPAVIQKRVLAAGVKEPAWIAKLTPEMKARILKEGLPLLSLTAFLAQMGQPPKEGAR